MLLSGVVFSLMGAISHCAWANCEVDLPTHLCLCLNGNPSRPSMWLVPEISSRLRPELGRGYAWAELAPAQTTQPKCSTRVSLVIPQHLVLFRPDRQCQCDQVGCRCCSYADSALPIVLREYPYRALRTPPSYQPVLQTDILHESFTRYVAACAGPSGHLKVSSPRSLIARHWGQASAIFHPQAHSGSSTCLVSFTLPFTPYASLTMYPLCCFLYFILAPLCEVWPF